MRPNTIIEIAKIILPENALLTKLVFVGGYSGDNKATSTLEVYVGGTRINYIEQVENPNLIRVVLDNLFINVGSEDKKSRTVLLRVAGLADMNSINPEVAFLEYL